VIRISRLSHTQVITVHSPEVGDDNSSHIQILFFEGKIGFFPSVRWVPEKRNGNIGVNSTPVMEQVSVDSVVNYDIMICEDGFHSIPKTQEDRTFF
jgi:hypothetical protein